MKIDRLKYTKEFQYHGISEWIGVEASVDNPETVQEDLLALRNKLVITFNAAISGSDVPVIEGAAKVDLQGDAEFEALKSKLDEFEFREDAQEYLDKNGWGYTVEAKLLINNKPLKK
mgnify:CR=1 FL=1